MPQPQVAENIARWWLLEGQKYEASRHLAGADWDVRAGAALADYGISLADKTDVREAISVLRPRWKWKPDPFFQLWDVVYPPKQFLALGGDDCDGNAMIHAQIVEEALGHLGYRAAIVSYFCDPFVLSHHFAIAFKPDGKIVAIQPQPSDRYPADLDPVWPEEFDTPEQASKTILAFCDRSATLIFHDVRDSMWVPLNPSA